jgi:hypothetical protein
MGENKKSVRQKMTCILNNGDELVITKDDKHVKMDVFCPTTGMRIAYRIFTHKDLHQS